MEIKINYVTKKGRHVTQWVIGSPKVCTNHASEKLKSLYKQGIEAKAIINDDSREVIGEVVKTAKNKWGWYCNILDYKEED